MGRITNAFRKITARLRTEDPAAAPAGPLRAAELPGGADLTHVTGDHLRLTTEGLRRIGLVRPGLGDIGPTLAAQVVDPGESHRWKFTAEGDQLFVELDDMAAQRTIFAEWMDMTQTKDAYGQIIDLPADGEVDPDFDAERATRQIAATFGQSLTQVLEHYR